MGVAGEESSQSWFSCQTGEQFWQDSFEFVGVYMGHNEDHRRELNWRIQDEN